MPVKAKHRQRIIWPHRHLAGDQPAIACALAMPVARGIEIGLALCLVHRHAQQADAGGEIILELPGGDRGVFHHLANQHLVEMQWRSCAGLTGAEIKLKQSQWRPQRVVIERVPKLPLRGACRRCRDLGAAGLDCYRPPAFRRFAGGKPCQQQCAGAPFRGGRIAVAVLYQHSGESLSRSYQLALSQCHPLAPGLPIPVLVPLGQQVQIRRFPLNAKALAFAWVDAALKRQADIKAIRGRAAAQGAAQRITPLPGHQTPAAK